MRTAKQAIDYNNSIFVFCFTISIFIVILVLACFSFCVFPVDCCLRSELDLKFFTRIIKATGERNLCYGDM